MNKLLLFGLLFCTLSVGAEVVSGVSYNPSRRAIMSI